MKILSREHLNELMDINDPTNESYLQKIAHILRNLITIAERQGMQPGQYSSFTNYLNDLARVTGTERKILTQDNINDIVRLGKTLGGASLGVKVPVTTFPYNTTVWGNLAETTDFITQLRQLSAAVPSTQAVTQGVINMASAYTDAVLEVLNNKNVVDTLVHNKIATRPDFVKLIQRIGQIAQYLHGEAT